MKQDNKISRAVFWIFFIGIAHCFAQLSLMVLMNLTDATLSDAISMLYLILNPLIAVSYLGLDNDIYWFYFTAIASSLIWATLLMLFMLHRKTNVKKWIIRLVLLIALFFMGIFIHALISYYNPKVRDTSWVEESKLRVKGLFFPPESMGQHRQEWYAKHLSTMSESILWNSESQAETYRFTWLRTFNKPICIRIDLSTNSTASLTYKILDGAGGYEPGTIETENSILLTQNQVDELRIQIRKSRFWKTKTDFHDEFICILAGYFNFVPIIGCDGAQWIFEAKTTEKYHVVDRWCGGEETYRNLCLHVLELSGIKIEEGDIY